MPSLAPRFGPLLLERGVAFRCYAPGAGRVELVLGPGSPDERRVRMQPVCGRGPSPSPDGFFEALVDDAGPGTRYRFRRDDGPPLPDPASRLQPEGVQGPSEVVDARAFTWTDQAWRGLSPRELVIYELHVGTFTPEGTFAGVGSRLGHLAALGVTALELMPLAAFPGRRNWGYDGVFHFAPFAGYGTPAELAALVDACHRRGLAVILDLVTNHFGPQGNAMWTLAPGFFRPDRPTAWSSGLDWESEAVLRYFDEVAAYWISAFHLDGLRLDAFHAVPPEFRERHLRRMVGAMEAALRAEGRDRRAFVLLESVDNQVSLLECGTEHVSVAQLNFDFQRASHALLTGERHGEYQDFEEPELELALCLEAAFAFSGRYSAHHGRVRGETDFPTSWDQVASFLGNHDTAGNRFLGLRLDALVDADRVRAATALMLLHPAIPFLFMGQEWGAATPFHFFIDLEPDLCRLAQAGRLRLFREMGPPPWPVSASACFDEEAFTRSMLDWTELERPAHAERLAFVRELLALRRRFVREMSPRVEDTRLEREGACYTLTIAARDPGRRSFVLLAALASSGEIAVPEGQVLFATGPVDAGRASASFVALLRI